MLIATIQIYFYQGIREILNDPEVVLDMANTIS